MGNRHTYTDEFKADCVAHSRSSDQPRYKIAEALGVSDGSLTKWIKDAERTAMRAEILSDGYAQVVLAECLCRNHTGPVSMHSV